MQADKRCHVADSSEPMIVSKNIINDPALYSTHTAKTKTSYLWLLFPLSRSCSASLI